MLPNFPNFQKLHINHHDELLRFYEKYEPYSDFNFISLYSWNIDDNAEISLLNDNLVIKLKDYTQDGFIFTFIGSNKIDQTTIDLLDYLEREGAKPQIKLMPELVVDSISLTGKKLFFEIEEDKDQFDYIFSIDKLMNLKSGEYKKKRNLIVNLKKTVKENLQVKKIDIGDSHIFNSIMELTDGWSKHKINNQKKINQDEIKSLVRVRTFAKFSKLLSVGIYNGTKLLAFSINEIVHNDYAITHFEKSDPNFVGSGEMLIHATALELHKKGIKFLNFEQDLGELNLRITKTLWRPVKFLKKYTISKK